MSLDNIKTILQLYKNDAVTIDQALELLAETMTANVYKMSLENNNNWTYTTTADESLSTGKE